MCVGRDVGCCGLHTSAPKETPRRHVRKPEETAAALVMVRVLPVAPLAVVVAHAKDGGGDGLCAGGAGAGAGPRLGGADGEGPAAALVLGGGGGVVVVAARMGVRAVAGGPVGDGRGCVVEEAHVEVGLGRRGSVLRIGDEVQFYPRAANVVTRS